MRTKIEVAFGALFLLLLAFVVHDQYRKAVDNAVAEARAKVLSDSDKRLTDALNARDEAYKRESQAKDAEIAQAKKSVVQMVAYANQHTDAPKPIIHVGNPETVTLHTDDAVIPYQSAPAFFDAYAKGQKCTTTDLPKCTSDLKDWETKYDLKTQESAQWENAAKGGSWLKRLGSNAAKVAIGVAIGYAIHH